MTSRRRFSAAAVAHDLRTPLNAIRGWAHVLESSLPDADPTVRRALAGILMGVEQQARLIDRMVQMEGSMQDTSKKPPDRPQRSPVDVPDPDTLEGPGNHEEARNKEDEREKVTRRGER
jgi:signal transduction histidine kinase